MFIFISLYVLVSLSCVATRNGCNTEMEHKHLNTCLRQWKIMWKYKDVPSAFLTNSELTEEICYDGVTISEMEKCIARNVNPACDNILVYWKGYRDTYTYICQHYTEFIHHSPCRENSHFVSKYDKCVRANFKRLQANPSRESSCSSFHVTRDCIRTSLQRHCSNDATRLLLLVLDTGNLPIARFMKCPLVNDNVKSLDGSDEQSPPQHPYRQHVTKKRVHSNRPVSNKQVQHNEQFTEMGKPSRNRQVIKYEVLYNNGMAHRSDIISMLLTMVGIAISWQYT